jgi:hypothetical protein
MSLPKMRKYLSAPGLLAGIRRTFEKISDPRSRKSPYSLVDILMSGLAMFSLKYPSLLKFDEHRHEKVIRHNLQMLYGVNQAPCDTQMREVMDPVDPEELRRGFRTVIGRLQRDKVLSQYQWRGRYWISIDGTGHFSSNLVSCPECCVKHAGTEKESYYHQLLCAVLIHPEKKTVLPLAAEAIHRQDGKSKNDCELSAAKRLLRKLKEDFPYLQGAVIVEDGLYSKGPPINLLKELGFHFVIVAKEGDHPTLFQTVRERLATPHYEEIEREEAPGIVRGYRWMNGIPLNATHRELEVNYLDFWERVNEEEKNFTWVTDLSLSEEVVSDYVKGGRSRWKIENETFNTLKNQGYHLEHNYGHGKQHLSTVLALLMLLAFLVDQVQEFCCALFQEARQKFHSRTSLWDKMKALFTGYYIPSWQILWEAIIQGHVGAVLQPDTS